MIIIKRINEVLLDSKKLSDEQLHLGLDLANKKSFGAKDKLGASLPTKEKEDAKTVLKDQLKALEVYDKCLRVFNDIQK